MPDDPTMPDVATGGALPLDGPGATAVKAATPSPHGGHALPILLVVVLGAISFGPALTAPFVGEDLRYVAENTHIRRLGDIPSFFDVAYWNRPDSGPERAYRPVVELTFAVDYAVWKSWAGGYRLTSLLLHVLAAVALYAVAFQLSRQRVTALAAAALFAVHPLGAEAINTVKDRGDILAALFLLLSWLTFVRVVDRTHARQTAGQQPASPVAGLVFGIFLFALALFSKETAVTLPILLLVYTAALVPVGWRGWAGAQTLVWWVALWGYLALILAAIQRYAPATFVNQPEGGRLLLVVKSLGRNLLLLVAPASLTVDHPFSPLSEASSRWQAWPVIGTLVALGVLVLVCMAVFRRHRLAAFAIAWLIVTLLPVSNVVPLGEPWIAEHRLYLPLIGFCLLVGSVVGAVASQRIGRVPVFAGAYRVAVIVVAVAVVAAAARSATRSALWARAVPQTRAGATQANTATALPR